MPEKVAVVGMGHRLRDVPHGRDFSTPRYLFVGVDWTRKNGRAVLDAFERVKALHPTATLDLVGRHPDVHRAGVTGHGYLRRDNPDAQALLDRLFASSTAFVLPSLFDPSPVAYLEAASAGLPVIATTYGGAGELLGPAAISVDPHDSEAIVSAMLAVANPTRAQAMGMAARRVAEDSSWDRVAARITTPLLLGSLRTDARLA